MAGSGGEKWARAVVRVFEGSNVAVASDEV